MASQPVLQCQRAAVLVDAKHYCDAFKHHPPYKCERSRPWLEALSLSFNIAETVYLVVGFVVCRYLWMRFDPSTLPSSPASPGPLDVEQLQQDIRLRSLPTDVEQLQKEIRLLKDQVGRLVAAPAPGPSGPSIGFASANAPVAADHPQQDNWLTANQRNPDSIEC